MLSMTQVVSIQSLGPGDTPLTPQNPLTEMLVSHSPEKSSLCTTQSSLIILLQCLCHVVAHHQGVFLGQNESAAPPRTDFPH